MQLNRNCPLVTHILQNSYLSQNLIQEGVTIPEGIVGGKTDERKGMSQ